MNVEGEMLEGEKNLKAISCNALLADEGGDAAVEWLVLASLVIALIGSVLWSIFANLRVKLTDVNNGL